MDAVAFAKAAKQEQRIKKVIAEPDSIAGLVSVPNLVPTGETITIPAGRTVVHPNLKVDGTLTVDGTLFIPSGSTYTATEVDATVVKQNGSVVANDSTVVHKTGNETKTGVLTLTDGLKLQGQNVSPFSGFKNYIINGNFDVWQRGASHTSIGYGSADRWSSNIVGNGTFLINRDIDDTINGRKINTCAASLITVGTTTAIGLATRLEDMMRFAGKTLTLSFYAVSNSTAPIAVYYGRYYSGMTYSPEIIVGNGNPVIIKYTTTFTVPSYAGESYSPTNSFFEIVIRQNRTTAGTLRIAQVQLEEGSVATPFEQRPYGLELSLCQRYYWTTTAYSQQSQSVATASGSQDYQYTPFPTSMRIAPSIVASGGAINGSQSFQSDGVGFTSIITATSTQIVGCSGRTIKASAEL